MENIAVPLSLNEEFNSILPAGWGTNIVAKKIVEGEDKFPNVELHFFIKCTNEEEFGKWLREFENLTNSSYIVACTDIKDGAQIKLGRRLRCHHSTRCPKIYDPSLKNKTRNTNCPSKLNVKIHVIRKKYRGKQEKYQLIKEAPCEIRLILTHNHITSAADSLRFRKVGDNVREELLSLYQNGHTPGTALEMIKCNIQLTRDDYVTALSDRNICPSYKYCYDLYMREFKKNYGPSAFNTNSKMFLENKLMLYNTKQKEKCAKMVVTGEGNIDYVIGICTPIMKRVHKHIEAASEIVFIDSSETVDRHGKHRSRIFVLLTHSECGGLPLGLIVTTSESVDAIKLGFNILKELVGESIFGGHKEGPKVFMTEDSASEQEAIFDTWPQSERMLCVFHVLHAVFRWISKTKNGIPKHQQTIIYKDFRNILYSENIQEMTSNYYLALENANSFPNYINYINNYWWPKRECWVKAYRRRVLMKNKHTNNISESTIHQIKDKIFSRIKAFNVVQIVDFMLSRFEDYTARKLLDAISNRPRENLLHKKIVMPSSELIERIRKLSDNIVAVPSETKPNLMYLVNIEVLTCSCIVGTTGAICKHIDWANMFFGTEKYVTKIDNLQIKENIYFVATGQTSKNDWHINSTAESSTASLNQVGSDNSLSLIEEMHLCTGTPKDSTVGQLQLLNHEEIKKTYKDLMSNINQVFNKYFEESPLEVISSMKKMMSTLNNIKTPEAFSYAVATFGCGAGGHIGGMNSPVKKTAVGRVIKKEIKEPRTIIYIENKKTENI